MYISASGPSSRGRLTDCAVHHHSTKRCSFRSSKYCNNYSMRRNWKDGTQSHVNNLCQSPRDFSPVSFIRSYSLKIKAQSGWCSSGEKTSCTDAALLITLYGPWLDPVWRRQWRDRFLGHTNSAQLNPNALLNILKAFPLIHHHLWSSAE